MKLPALNAIGTSLGVIAMPVMVLGAMEHYKAGNLNLKFAVLIALGLLIGAYFGAKIVISLPPALVRKIYGVFLLAVAARMLLAGK